MFYGDGVGVGSWRQPFYEYTLEFLIRSIQILYLVVCLAKNTYSTIQNYLLSLFLSNFQSRALRISPSSIMLSRGASKSWIWRVSHDNLRKKGTQTRYRPSGMTRRTRPLCSAAGSRKDIRHKSLLRRLGFIYHPAVWRELSVPCRTCPFHFLLLNMNYKRKEFI